METSTKSPVTWGPRSFTRKTKDLLFLRLVTSILEPRGKVRCAAVSSLWSNASPLAVTPPDSSPYQLATPSSLGSELMGSSVNLGATRGKADHASVACKNEAGGLASDGAVKVTTAATPQPVTSLLMPPPNEVSSHLSRSSALSIQSVQGSLSENTEFCRKCQVLIGVVGRALPSFVGRCEKIGALPPAVRKGSALPDLRLNVKLLGFSRLPESCRLSAQQDGGAALAGGQRIFKGTISSAGPPCSLSKPSGSLNVL